jgi:uncharacterized paraquat-inducible protein A
MKYLRRVQSIVSSRALLALLVALLLAGVASACPTCKDALAEADPQQKSVAVGYYYSILFMMSMPFAILGGFVGLAYLSIRRACQLPSSDENVRDEV